MEGVTSHSPPPSDAEARRVCAEKGDRAVLGSTNVEGGYSSYTSDEVPPAWRAVYYLRLAEAISQTLIRLQIRCPYEPHDTDRVFRWIKQHPLHLFDLRRFKELVSTQLANLR